MTRAERVAMVDRSRVGLSCGVNARCSDWRAPGSIASRRRRIA